MSERTEIEAHEIISRIEWVKRFYPEPTRPQLMAAIGFVRTTYANDLPYTPPAVIGKGH